MLGKGAALGFTLIEPATAECYFCNRVGVKDTKEHVIPQWLFAELGMDAQEYGSRLMNRGTVLEDRGAIPARNFVAKGICAKCNQGWMSTVESGFQPFIQQSPKGASLVAVAKWFIKTGFVLNVSQPMRLLVPRDLRLDLAGGKLGERVSLYFHRTSEKLPADFRLDFLQTAWVAWMAADPGKEAARWKSSQQVWCCSIRIDDIVGTVVVSPPGETWASCWAVPGRAAVVDGKLAAYFDWKKLPSVRHFEHAAWTVPKKVGWTKSYVPVKPFPNLGGLDSINTFLEVISKEYPQNPPVAVGDVLP